MRGTSVGNTFETPRSPTSRNSKGRPEAAFSKPESLWLSASMRRSPAPPLRSGAGRAAPRPRASACRRWPAPHPNPLPAGGERGLRHRAARRRWGAALRSQDHETSVSPSPRRRGEGASASRCPTAMGRGTPVSGSRDVGAPSPGLRGEGWGEGPLTRQNAKRPPGGGLSNPEGLWFSASMRRSPAPP